jgi:DNA-binding LacI/PurR family transcriptional regulator
VTKVISPALSCVTQPSYELGAKGVELTLKTILHPDSSREQHLVLPTELVLRGTCTGMHEVLSPNNGNGGSPVNNHE